VGSFVSVRGLHRLHWGNATPRHKQCHGCVAKGTQRDSKCNAHTIRATGTSPRLQHGLIP